MILPTPRRCARDRARRGGARGAAAQLNEGGAARRAWGVLAAAQRSLHRTAPVSVKLVPPAGDLLEVKPLELTFSPSDWATPQRVRVQALDDAVLDASPHREVILHQLRSSDVRFGPRLGSWATPSRSRCSRPTR